MQGLGLYTVHRVLDLGLIGLSGLGFSLGLLDVGFAAFGFVGRAIQEFNVRVNPERPLRIILNQPLKPNKGKYQLSQGPAFLGVGIVTIHIPLWSL